MSVVVTWVLLALGGWVLASVAVAVLLGRGGLSYLTRRESEPETETEVAVAGSGDLAARAEPAEAQAPVPHSAECEGCVTEVLGSVPVAVADGTAGGVPGGRRRLELTVIADARPDCPRTRLAAAGPSDGTADEAVEGEVERLRREIDHLEAEKAVLTCAATYAAAHAGSSAGPGAP